MRILFDGWPLVHAPLSPQALHLLAVLAHLPQEVMPVVAFPQPVPDWMVDLETRLLVVPDTPFGKLRWEQFHLPGIARKEEIDILHLTAPVPPVLSNLEVILSPSVFGDGEGPFRGSQESVPFLDRLRQSLAHGGMVRVKQILWPFDLPDPLIPGRLAWVSPILPPGFAPASPRGTNAGGPPAIDKLGDLPDEFIIYHGPGDKGSLERLLQAWTWAAAIGESHPLLLLGIDSAAMIRLAALSQAHDLGGSFHFVGDVRPDLLPEIYRRCSAVFHPAPASPWSGPVRLALACGKPLVASESRITDAITGPAAYLAPASDPRALGAALVTVIVEQQIAERLAAAAERRAANWEMEKYSAQLWEVYNQAFSA